mmetsp:Transcript_1318/g.2800  ORF Transcript_1318/g.2800 Transcript_1318/m.2800 type:complete len:170 (-) Transcript_1318:221-730(-)
MARLFLLASCLIPTAVQAFAPPLNPFARPAVASQSTARPRLTRRDSLFTDPGGWFKRTMEVMNDKREAEALHILMPYVKKEGDGVEVLAKMEEIKAGIAGVEDFEEAAKKYSTCPSAAKGGSLGKFKRGVMVPNFDDAAFTGETGTVLGPVNTIYGAHLIWVKSREEVA